MERGGGGSCVQLYCYRCQSLTQRRIKALDGYRCLHKYAHRYLLCVRFYQQGAAGVSGIYSGRGTCQPYLSLLTNQDPGLGYQWYSLIDDINSSRRSLFMVLAVAFEFVAFCISPTFCEQARCSRKTNVGTMNVAIGTC